MADSEPPPYEGDAWAYPGSPAEETREREKLAGWDVVGDRNSLLSDDLTSPPCPLPLPSPPAPDRPGASVSPRDPDNVRDGETDREITDRYERDPATDDPPDTPPEYPPGTPGCISESTAVYRLSRLQ